MRMPANGAVLLLLLFSVLSTGAPGLTITGRVVDSLGRRIPEVTVMVYHAGVQTATAPFVPVVTETAASG